MKNIWVNGCLSALAIVTVLPISAGAQSQLKPPLQGLISMGDITFRNVTVDQAPSEPTDFLLCQDAGPSGKCPNTFLEPITFENLRIAGRPVRSIEDLKAKVAPVNRAKIIFR